MCLNILDIITGIFYAFKERKIKSRNLRDGVFKKVGFVLTYFLGYLVDYYGCLIGLAFDFSVLNVICTMVCITEITSILENLSNITGQASLFNKLTDLLRFDKKGE